MNVNDGKLLDSTKSNSTYLCTFTSESRIDHFLKNCKCNSSVYAELLNIFRHYNV